MMWQIDRLISIYFYMGKFNKITKKLKKLYKNTNGIF